MGKIQFYNSSNFQTQIKAKSLKVEKSLTVLFEFYKNKSQLCAKAV